MTKQISEYTTGELSTKIEAIKAEIQKTAEALKKCEEELEQRKHKVQLGIPLDEALSSVFSCYQFGFASEESQRLFHARLTDYVEALQKLAEGKPISIKAIAPLLQKGWVAMDKDGRWHWYMEKPHIEKFYFCWNTGSPAAYIGGFNLKPAENWETSLMECGI